MGRVFVLMVLCACGPSTKAGPDGQGGGDGGDNTRQCSDDLHDILDKNGAVVETCPLDQGCFQGQCIEACEAAAQSKGNLGCDFIVSTPHFYTSILPPCFAAFVANGWGSEAQIEVTRGGNTYDPGQFGRIADGSTSETNWAAIPSSGIPNEEVGVLFLSHDPQSRNSWIPLICPVSPAISTYGGTASSWDNSSPNSTTGQAWRIKTNVPVSTYDILPYGGASSFLPSAQLVMPVSALGTNFVVTMPKPSKGKPWFQVVAIEDGTSIDVLPKVTLPSGDVPVGPVGVVSTFTANAGEYIQWQLNNEENSGTVITSNKPIAVVSGDTRLCYDSLTSSGGGCDSGHQIVPPVRALGSRYVGAPYRTRSGSGPESIYYRVTAIADDTVLTFSPGVAGAPTTLDSGQIIDFQTTEPFVISSQDEDHPLYVAQMMSGCKVDSQVAGCLGDEEFVVMLPPAQFLRRYVFFTDPSYPYTTLTLTRVADSQGNFADVSIACHGNITGWQPAGSDGQFEVATFDLVWNGAGTSNCQNGQQVAESDLPFGVTVWGMDTYSSYAYSAGGNAAVINDVVVVE